MEGSTDLGNMKYERENMFGEQGGRCHFAPDEPGGCNLRGSGRDQAEVAEAGLAGHRRGSQQHTGGHRDRGNR